MYESRKDRPLPPRAFLRRLGVHFIAALALFAMSLALGMWGYGHFEHLGWRDGMLPQAERVGRGILTLPLFPAMHDGNVARVCQSLATTCKQFLT